MVIVVVCLWSTNSMMVEHTPHPNMLRPHAVTHHSPLLQQHRAVTHRSLLSQQWCTRMDGGTRWTPPRVLGALATGGSGDTPIIPDHSSDSAAGAAGLLGSYQTPPLVPTAPLRHPRQFKCMEDLLSACTISTVLCGDPWWGASVGGMAVLVVVLVGWGDGGVELTRIDHQLVGDRAEEARRRRRHGGLEIPEILRRVDTVLSRDLPPFKKHPACPLGGLPVQVYSSKVQFSPAGFGACSPFCLQRPGREGQRHSEAAPHGHQSALLRILYPPRG